MAASSPTIESRMRRARDTEREQVEALHETAFHLEFIQDKLASRRRTYSETLRHAKARVADGWCMLDLLKQRAELRKLQARRDEIRLKIDELHADAIKLRERARERPKRARRFADVAWP